MPTQPEATREFPPIELDIHSRNSEIGFVSLHIHKKNTDTDKEEKAPLDKVADILSKIKNAKNKMHSILPHLCKSRAYYLDKKNDENIKRCCAEGKCYDSKKGIPKDIIDISCGLMLGKGDICYLVNGIPSTYLANRMRVVFYESNPAAREILSIPCLRLKEPSLPPNTKRFSRKIATFTAIVIQSNSPFSEKTRYPMISHERLGDAIDIISKYLKGKPENRPEIFLTFQGAYRIIVKAEFNTLTEMTEFIIGLREHCFQEVSQDQKCQNQRIFHSTATQICLPISKESKEEIKKELEEWQTSNDKVSESIPVGLLIKTKNEKGTNNEEIIKKIQKLKLAGQGNFSYRIGDYDLYIDYKVSNIKCFASKVINHLYQIDGITGTSIIVHPLV